jgi:hypothetical protein
MKVTKKLEKITCSTDALAFETVEGLNENPSQSC